ncbi:pyridoxamine 5'-phosphate oxidase family protein [Phytoactinopolyspora endophytica]|uniref:pyridoxamine 5'-phosphate oxidase family protein n=1 Tax=Phytoactinopolyspora endophytica TaxID=1642495 RepID=UPI0013ECD1CF|nr:pyridoxamine 5'-phosphate oxidase family protein [Phytoactinopolyspora endophytica]
MRTEPVAEAMPPRGRGTEVDGGVETTLDWAKVTERLSRGGRYWLATVRPDGSPHVMPVFAVWSASAMYVVSKDSARKSRNLDSDGRCVITTEASDAHLILEGEARRVRDHETLERVSGAFETAYGWPTTVSGEELDAPYGAPTSGGPPYRVYEITPKKGFGFPAEGTFMPTRWRFS